MNPTFNAEEVLEIAAQIERNGAQFYRDAATYIQDEAAKQTLLELAAMEDGHEALFSSMREEPGMADNFLREPDSPAVAYLAAIAGNHVFLSKDNAQTKFSQNSDIGEVLKVALKAEMDTIALFSEVWEQMPEFWGRDKIKDIINEEKEHVILITQMIMDFAKRD